LGKTLNRGDCSRRRVIRAMQMGARLVAARETLSAHHVAGSVIQVFWLS
jgi:hypothetical protein